MRKNLQTFKVLAEKINTGGFKLLAEQYVTEFQETKAVLREHYEERRRCVETKRDGTRCRAWAVWGAPEQKCSSHLYSKRRRADEMTDDIRQEQHRRRAPTCDCSAYEWPHRQGNGFCQSPSEPIKKCPTPAGKRAPGKMRRRKINRILRKHGLKN